MEYTFFINALISMRTKIVTLSLDHVGGQNSGTVAVIIGNRSGEGRNRDTVLYRISNDITQRLLVVIGNLLEVRSQQQVKRSAGFWAVCGDFLQELRTDDAASTENLARFRRSSDPNCTLQTQHAAERSPERPDSLPRYSARRTFSINSALSPAG